MNKKLFISLCSFRAHAMATNPITLENWKRPPLHNCSKIFVQLPWLTNVQVILQSLFTNAMTSVHTFIYNLSHQLPRPALPCALCFSFCSFISTALVPISHGCHPIVSPHFRGTHLVAKCDIGLGLGSPSLTLVSIEVENMSTGAVDTSVKQMEHHLASLRGVCDVYLAVKSM
jgi:hypothetical protein